MLFFIWGIFGISRGIVEKRFDKKFLFSILSLILGIAGLVIPGAVEANNTIMLYMAAGWFVLRGILSILDAIAIRNEGGSFLMMVLGIVMGVLELILAVYSIAHPAVLAVSLGFLIGFYFIESGIDAILIGKATCAGGNNVTILFTVMGILTIIGGFSMLVTPLATFLGTGHCIVLLFFINGVVSIVQAISEGRYDKQFFFAVLSLILGIVCIAVPGIAEMSNSILFYMAAGWFLLRGAMTIFDAIGNREEGGMSKIFGIILGVLEVLMGVYSIAHPAVLAVSIGLLIALYFIESGAKMIFLGSAVSSAVIASSVMR
jgi:uncharacterized membrane protein HdeD (DUF308 family)